MCLIKLVFTYLGIEDALDSKESKNELAKFLILSDKILVRPIIIPTFSPLLLFTCDTFPILYELLSNVLKVGDKVLFRRLMG